MERKSIISAAVRAMTSKRQPWQKYDAYRVAHTFGFNESKKDILRAANNVRILSEKAGSDPEAAKTIEEHKKAMLCFKEAMDNYARAGEVGMLNERYLGFLKTARSRQKAGRELLNVSIGLKEGKYKPTPGEVHVVLAEMHDRYARANSLNPQKPMHIKYAREHRSVARIYEEPKQTSTLRNYSKRIIRESLNRFGLRSVDQLKVGPKAKGLQWRR